MTLDVAHKSKLAGVRIRVLPTVLALMTTAPWAGAASADSPREMYLRGKTAHESEEQRGHHRVGVALARAQLRAKPDDPEALLYLAANMGAGALVDGKMAALRVLPEMERLLLRLHQVAPAFENAAAARTLGRLYHVAPSLISIGSRDKARRWLETALKLSPRHPGTLVFAADFFRDEEEEDKARRLARQALAGLERGDYEPHEREWREIARDVLDAVGEE